MSRTRKNKEGLMNEEIVVGGGTTGVGMVPGPVGGKATLPNSKTGGEYAPPRTSPTQAGPSGEETNPENNTAPTGDFSKQNMASISSKLGTMREDVEEMFNGHDLTEEFKERASVIFEAAVVARINEEIASLEEQYNAALVEAYTNLSEELTDKLDEYLNYVVEEWMENNAVAVESSLRNEIMEEFVEGLKNLFAEHYIDVPEEKVNVVEALASKVEALEGKLNETIETNIELNNALTEAARQVVFNEVSKGLATTQVEKLGALAEGVTFENIETYYRKLEIVKENYFPIHRSEGSNILTESYEGNESPKQKFAHDGIANYVNAIARTSKK
jgi:hypothetical protein